MKNGAQRRIFPFFLMLFLFSFWMTNARAEEVSVAEDHAVLQETLNPDSANSPIFDDKMLLEGYFKRYQDYPQETILEMIKDDTLSSYRMAAAIRVFREKFSVEVVSNAKVQIEKILLRRFNRTDSSFVQVEIMATLCQMDRYRYFKAMVPVLIQKLDHYNDTVNEMAFNSLNSLLEAGTKRPREARIVFNTLRKVLFLSRKRLANITEPGPKLTQKLKLVRWSIKILGIQEIDKLPKEVINLL